MLSTRITVVVNSTTVTLADPASTTVAAAAVAYGTDDTEAILAAIDAAEDTGTLYFPGAIYTILGTSNGQNPMLHSGSGWHPRARRHVHACRGFVSMSNTVVLFSDATAGIHNGCARYEGFMCDGNNIAMAPVQNGTT